MCCVITDENDVVVQISLIPGTDPIVYPKGYHVYFPVTEKLPFNGDVFKPNLELQPWFKEEVIDHVAD